jgi:hypothetical protein
MRTNILLAGFTLTALFSAGTAFGADPRLLNLVMPDATTLAGANVTNAEITPFGQYILMQLTSSVNSSANQELQNFVTATGFDPRHDISEILAASSSNAAKPSGLVLAIGNFNVSQITTAITAKAPTETVQTYDGATLITSTNAKSNFSLAFLGTNIAIAGDTASVKAAIDRSQSANSINTALAVQVQALSTTEDAWVVTNSPLMSLISGFGGGFGAQPAPSATGTATPPASPFGQVFSSIQGSSGGVKFGTNVQITGQVLTTDAASATSLANVLQALVSIVSMSSGQDSQIATLAQILQGMTVTADGAAINVALSIPETQIETILNNMKNEAKPAVRREVRPAIAPRSLQAPATAQQ